MPTTTDPKQNEKYNPGEREYHRNFDEPLHSDDLESIPFANENNPAEEANIERAKAAAREAENRAVNGPVGRGTTAKTLPGQEAAPSNWNSNVSLKGQSLKGRGGLSTVKKVRYAIAGIGLISAMSGLVVAGIMGAFVSMKELALDFWHKNHYSAYSKRASSIQKRLFQEPDANCKGIRCRLKQGVSDKEIDKYKKAGLEPQVSEKGGKKYITSFTSVDKNGQPITVNKDNFKDFYKSSAKFRAQVSVVSTPSALVFRGAHALKTYTKFGIDRGKKALVKTKKEMRKIIYSGKKSDLRVKPNGDPADEQNKNAQLLNGVDESITQAAQGQIDELAASDFDRDPSIRPDVNNLNLNSSQAVDVGEGIIKNGITGAAYGVFSALNNGCSAYQLIRTVIFGAKVIAAAQLIKYAMLFMTNADALKAGDISPEGIGLLAGILMIPSKEKGPDYGKTAANSNLYSMIVGGGKVTSKTGLARFSTGTPFLRFLQDAKVYLESFGLNRTTCKHVKSWYGQIGLLAGGILVGIISGGTTSIAGIAAGAALGAMVAIMTQFVTPLLIQFAAGTLSPGPDDPGGGFAAGNAIGAGVGATASELGKGGLRPLTKDDATAVQIETQAEMVQIKAAERLGKSPFSIDDPYSITNRLALLVMPFVAAPTAQANYQNLASLATSPLRLVGNSINQLFSSKVSALDTDYGGAFCADEEYRDMNLLVDAYCNPVYGEKDEVLAGAEFESEAVVDYMVGQGHIEESDGTPKSDEYKKFLRACVDGSTPLSPDGGGADVGEDVDTRDCVKKDKKFAMFRMYVLDTNILDGINKSVEGTLGAGS